MMIMMMIIIIIIITVIKWKNPFLPAYGEKKKVKWL